MREKQISDLENAASTLIIDLQNLETTLASLYDANNASFDVSSVVNGTDSSTAEIIGRIHAVVGFVTPVEDMRANLIPLSFFNDFGQSVLETRNATNRLRSQLDQIQSGQGGLAHFDYSNFHASSRNGNTHNLQQYFIDLFQISDILLERFARMLIFFKNPTLNSFQVSADALTKVVNDTNTKLSETNKNLEATKARCQIIENLESDAKSNLGEIQRIKSESESEKKTISEYLSQSTQSNTSITSILEEATKLKNSVKSYQDQFDTFQAHLSERETTFASGSKQFNELVADLVDHNDRIEETILRSKSMLSSATVAGLASNYSGMKDKLTAELRFANISYYIGIILMAISALPLLALFLLPLSLPFIRYFYPELQLSANDFPAQPSNGWQYLAQILPRVAVLLPATLLVSFAARRHSLLFRLREWPAPMRWSGFSLNA